MTHGETTGVQRTWGGKKTIIGVQAGSRSLSSPPDYRPNLQKVCRWVNRFILLTQCLSYKVVLE